MKNFFVTQPWWVTVFPLLSKKCSYRIVPHYHNEQPPPPLFKSWLHPWCLNDKTKLIKLNPRNVFHRFYESFSLKKDLLRNSTYCVILRINSYEIDKILSKIQIFIKCFQQLSYQILQFVIKWNPFHCKSFHCIFKLIASQLSIILNW